MGRSLFLHHYLPAATCNYLLLGAVFQFMFIDGIDSPVSRLEGTSDTKYRKFHPLMMVGSPSNYSYLAASFILLGQLGMFVFLSPLTYGTPGMTVSQVIQHKILTTWDLQFGKFLFMIIMVVIDDDISKLILIKLVLYLLAK